MDWSFFPNTKSTYDEYIRESKIIYKKFEPFPLGDEVVVYEIEIKQLFEEYKTPIVESFEAEHEQYFGKKNTRIFSIDMGDFSTFKDWYLNNQSTYFMKFPDADEIDHVRMVYVLLIQENQIKDFIIDSPVYENIQFSKKKKLSYLIEKANDLGYVLKVSLDSNKEKVITYEKKEEIKNSNSTSKSTSKNLIWNGNQTQLIELCKALIESDAIKNSKKKGKQKELIEGLSSLFNIKIANPDKLIQDITNRNYGSETLFIDKLKESMNRFILNTKGK